MCEGVEGGGCEVVEEEDVMCEGIEGKRCEGVVGVRVGGC